MPGLQVNTSQHLRPLCQLAESGEEDVALLWSLPHATPRQHGMASLYPVVGRKMLRCQVPLPFLFRHQHSPKSGAQVDPMLALAQVSVVHPEGIPKSAHFSLHPALLGYGESSPPTVAAHLRPNSPPFPRQCP